MITYALDSNIISYLLKRDIQTWKRYNQEADAGKECVIPPIVYYEVKRGLLAVDATRQLQSFAKMCRDFGIGRMTNAVLDEAARLYAWHKKNGTMVADADLLIAAFCVVNDYVLVTHNTKHFVGIEGLQYTDWK